jgi:hypothetical protein
MPMRLFKLCLQLFLIVVLVNKYVKVESFETNEIALKLVP